MASTSAVSMAMPLTRVKPQGVPSSEALLMNSLPMRPSKVMARVSKPSGSFQEKAVSGLTAAALTASMVIPEVAEAARPWISPSLKNFSVSIVAGGGVVLGVIAGAVIGVTNFDPVKRS